MIRRGRRSRGTPGLICQARRIASPSLRAVFPERAGIMHVHSPHADGPLRISLALQGGEQKRQPGVSVRVCGDLVSGCAVRFLVYAT